MATEEYNPLTTRKALEDLCEKLGLTINTYNKGLYEALTTFWKAQSLNLRTSGDDSPASLSRIQKRNPQGFVIIMNAAGEIVGTCLFLFDGLSALLTHLAVSPTFRGKGLANALMDYAHAVSFAKGAQYMYLYIRAGAGNEDLRRYYSKYGYVVGDTPSTVMFKEGPDNLKQGPVNE